MSLIGSLAVGQLRMMPNVGGTHLRCGELSENTMDFGAAMLPMAELEYTGIMEKLKAIEPRFYLRTGG